MKRPGIFISFAAAMTFAAPSFGQSDETAVDTIWTLFTDLCAPIVNDPLTVFDGQPEDLPLEALTWKQTGDGASVFAEFEADGTEAYAALYAHRASDGQISLLCEMMTEGEFSGSPEDRLAVVRDFLASNDALTVSAGLFADTGEGSHEDYSEAPEAALVVEGAFEPSDSLAAVYVLPYGLHVAVRHMERP